MTPLERYRADLSRKDFFADKAQEYVVLQIQDLFDQLLATTESKGLLSYIGRKFRGDGSAYIEGLYLWGGVGRGKTYLVDSFYDCLPIKEKKRFHFYRFMRMVHAQLAGTRQIPEPLKLVGDSISADTRVLCLDEFYVSDITDAMLLGGLFQALFERRVVLILTSNCAPPDLYRDGLQRQRFLPAIALIEKYMKVVNIDSDIDYRLCFLDRSDVYHISSDSGTDNALASSFEHIAVGKVQAGTKLKLNDRMIRTVRYADGVVWFDFSVICGEFRGADDYIEIARSFQTVIVSGVPIMDEAMNDKARRFIALIDEFYDRNVKLILSAATEPSGLYTGNFLSASFLRASSRLEEMRTRDYFKKAHII